MTGNGSKKVVHIHPAIAEELRKINLKAEKAADESSRLSSELLEGKKARKALEKKGVIVEDLPGKHLPFKYQINVPIVGGTDDAVTGTVNVARDGLFVCRRIYASLLITDAPIIEFTTVARIHDYTDFIGKYTPLTSRRFYTFWANAVKNAFSFNAVYPPFDFEWEYNDSGLERDRQDKPISGDILNRQDGDGYLMNNEIFAAGTTINFIVRPTRQVGVIDTSLADGTDEQTGFMDLELQVTFDGFKVLQPLET